MMMFVLGMLAWQVVTAVVYFVTNEDDEKALLCGFGVCAVVLAIISAIYHQYMMHYYRKYNFDQFYGGTEKGNGNGWIGNYYMTPENAERFNLIERDATPEAYSVRLLRTGKEFKNIPFRNDILNAAKIETGFPGMSKDFIAKFFKRA